MIKNRFLLFFASLLIGSIGSAKINATQLNREIQKAGADWVAADNWVSELDPAQARRMMGVQMESGEGLEFAAPEGARTTRAFPAILDWRNKDGKNWVTPMLNQANCGSCVAFAAVGVLETQYRISTAFPWFNIKLSPQNLFSCGGGSCDMGWRPEGAARFLKTTGVPDEACMPYKSGATGKDIACSASCADTAKRTIKIANSTKPTSFMKNIEKVREALQKGPVVTTLSVYNDFLAYSSGVYKHVTGAAMGGHAVSIVGYDDTLKAFIIRNSWGEEWGEKGFGYVSYEDTSGIGNDTWLYEIASMAGAVSVDSPVDYDHFSGTIPFKGTSTFANTKSLDIKISDDVGRVVWSGSCTTMTDSTCSQDIQAAAYRDGKYEVQVSAVGDQGQMLGTSTKQFFYVANAQPTLNLSYVGADGLDLAAPIKGRIEFNIKATTTSVPMSSIVFHYVGPDGVVKTKTANVVLEEMTLGWRTTTIPNGEYQIWMVGHVKTNNYDATVETEKRKVLVKN
ncbi:MAG: C1 family peptidase [Bdellovibrionota bacterium]